MNKHLKILAVAALLAYPVSIQADIVLVAPSATASSSVTAVPAIIPASRSTIKAAPSIAILATTTIATTTINTKLVNITAYASVPDETSAHPFVTASGKTVADGVVAANWLPFGTQIEIPTLFGNKIFTVEDRTSPRFGGRVDVWMPTVAAAVAFGLHPAQVIILSSALAAMTSTIAAE
jgi:3D (Asp-Asp-Asp) domain-containing protein